MTVHPLQAVREERAHQKQNRDLGGLIRTAILDRLKTTGECTADDLIPLYPVGMERRCRSLATAYFGSLSSAPEGKQPLIREKGRVKSIIPERKGAKNTIWEFTRAGWNHCGVVGMGGTGNEGPAPSDSDDSSGAGVPSPQGPAGTSGRPHGASTGASETLTLFDQRAA